MTDRELMQMVFKAIDAVNDFSSNSIYAGIFDLEVKLLRSRLAQPEWIATTYVGDGQRETNVYYDEAKQQPEQEPVAWVECDGQLVWNNREAAIGRNLYTAPPQREWQGLTNEEIMDACSAVWASHPIEVGRVVEEKLKEKNS